MAKNKKYTINVKCDRKWKNINKIKNKQKESENFKYLQQIFTDAKKKQCNLNVNLKQKIIFLSQCNQC